jgi:hypothetical protein
MPRKVIRCKVVATRPKVARAKAKVAPIVPQSINPHYQCRDVTKENRDTLRGGCYFVQLAGESVFRTARFTRGDGFYEHKQPVQPVRVFTCDRMDAKAYCNLPIDGLPAGCDPALRPYL